MSAIAHPTREREFLRRDCGFSGKEWVPLPTKSGGMALYYLHHDYDGKTSGKPKYHAARRVAYYVRDNACSLVIGHMPKGYDLTVVGLQQWLIDGEDRDEKHARICDRLTVSLPIELPIEKQVEIIHAFMERISHGEEIGWYAAIHNMGEDDHNPHAHITFRDRRIIDGHEQTKRGEKGKRVVKTTDKGTLEVMRAAWADVMNDGLKRSGRSERVDHRSYEARGIDKVPTIPLGYAEKLEKKGIRTKRGDINREVYAVNAAVREAKEIVRLANRNKVIRCPEEIIREKIHDVVIRRNESEVAYFALVRKKKTLADSLKREMVKGYLAQENGPQFVKQGYQGPCSRMGRINQRWLRMNRRLDRKIEKTIKKGLAPVLAPTRADLRAERIAKFRYERALRHEQKIRDLYESPAMYAKLKRDFDRVTNLRLEAEQINYDARIAESASQRANVSWLSHLAARHSAGGMQTLARRI